MKPTRLRLRKWLLALAKLLVVLVVLWFIRKTLHEAWIELQQGQWHFHWGWLALCGGVYLIGLLGPALFWHQVLRLLGQTPHLTESLRAYYISHLGKYVPGKAMVIVLRAGLIYSERVQIGIAAVTTFIETLTMMAVGAFVALALLLLEFRERLGLMVLALGLMVVAGLPTLPPMVRLGLRWFQWGENGQTVQEAIPRYGLKAMLLGWGYMLFCWVVLGISLGCCLQGMGIEVQWGSIGQLGLWIATVALAVVAGFLSLVPGGMVVREAVLLSLLAPHVGQAVALASAVLLRLVWLVAELGISGILYGGRWTIRNASCREECSQAGGSSSEKGTTAHAFPGDSCL